MKFVTGNKSLYKVGITYDLKSDYEAAGYCGEETAELDTMDTVLAIADALSQLGCETQTIGGVTTLAAELAGGKRWDLVFNICEGMHGMGRESLVPALLDHYRVPYTFSDPLVLALTLHKGVAKALLRQAGVKTPRYIVISDVAELRHATAYLATYPIFAKPVAEGSGKGIGGSSIISSLSEFESVTANLLQRFGQPVLVEEYLPGREFTVGLTGTADKAAVIGIAEVFVDADSEAGTYCYENKTNYVQHVTYAYNEDIVGGEVADKCKSLALRAYTTLGLRDAGRVDIRLDGLGEPGFIEINALPGLKPGYSDLPLMAEAAGKPYAELIRHIVESAMERVVGTRTRTVFAAQRA